MRKLEIYNIGLEEIFKSTCSNHNFTRKEVVMTNIIKIANTVY